MSPKQRRVLNALLFGAFMTSMDRTIVSIALPAVVDDLGATAYYSWIASAYIFAGALILPVAGRLLDIRNGKSLMLSATMLFVIGSVLCGLSPNAFALIVARFLQGIGGGAFLAMGAGLVGILFEPKDRAPVAGQLGMVLAVAGVVAPVVGGLLTHHLGWRSVFFVNVPTGFAVYFVLWRSLEDIQPASSGRMDWWGALTVVLWSLPLLILTSQSDFAAFGMTNTVICVLVFLLALGAFVVMERKIPHPLFDFALLKNPVFLWAVLGIWWLGSASTSTTMYFPLFLIQVLDQTTMQAGLTLTSLVAGMLLGSNLLGRLSARLGAIKPVLLMGTLGVTGALLGLSQRMSPELPHWEVAAWLFLIGLSLGMSVSGFPVVVQNAIELDRIGTATASVQFSKAMGAALGTAFLGALMTSTLTTSIPEQLRQRLAADGLPSSETVFEEPRSVGAKFQDSLKQLCDQLDRAGQGDQSAHQELRRHPLLADQSEALLQTPRGREQLKSFLSSHIGKLSSEVEQEAKSGFLQALRRVMVGSTFTGLFAFLLVLPMREEKGRLLAADSKISVE